MKKTKSVYFKLLLSLALIFPSISIEAGILRSCSKVLFSWLLLTGHTETNARVTISEGTFLNPIMRFDNQDILGAVAYREDTESLVYIRCTDKSCTENIIFKNITSGTGMGRRSDFVYDANNLPYIVYEDTSNSDIYLVTCSDTFCNTMASPIKLAETYQAQYPCIQLSPSDGYPSISFYNSTYFMLLKCNSNPCIGAGAQEVNIVDKDGNSGKKSSQVIDKNGNPLMVYYSIAGKALKLAHCFSAICNNPTTRYFQTLGDVVPGSEIRLRTNKKPTILYTDEATKLKLIYGANEIFTISNTTVIDTSVVSGTIVHYNMQLHNDLPFILYIDPSSAAQALKLICCSNPDCRRNNSEVVIDTIGMISEERTFYLQVDFFGNPFVMHYNDNDKALYLSKVVLYTTLSPTGVPTLRPSLAPSNNPSISPSSVPSSTPSLSPSDNPSISPSSVPSSTPSLGPSISPSISPSGVPSLSPSVNPSISPSGVPSLGPSINPSISPSGVPSLSPSVNPSISPSGVPSLSPSINPSISPSSVPSLSPSINPSVPPSSVPSLSPSINPSISPSIVPSHSPSFGPSGTPSTFPTKVPTKLKTNDIPEKMEQKLAQDNSSDIIIPIIVSVGVTVIVMIAGFHIYIKYHKKKNSDDHLPKGNNTPSSNKGEYRDHAINYEGDTPSSDKVEPGGQRKSNEGVQLQELKHKKSQQNYLNTFQENNIQPNLSLSFQKLNSISTDSGQYQEDIPPGSPIQKFNIQKPEKPALQVKKEEDSGFPKLHGVSADSKADERAFSPNYAFQVKDKACPPIKPSKDFDDEHVLPEGVPALPENGPNSNSSHYISSPNAQAVKKHTNQVNLFLNEMKAQMLIVDDLLDDENDDDILEEVNRCHVTRKGDEQESNDNDSKDEFEDLSIDDVIENFEI
ncbi:MAG: hypothetical protein AAF335_00715 [Bacteroidota bacterium]